MMRPTLGRLHGIAVGIMMDLAWHSRGGPVATEDLGRRACISQSYLERVLARLRRHGLVRTLRGPQGGNLLGRGAAQISVTDIIGAVDRPQREGRGRRSRGGVADRAGRCLSYDLWDTLEALQVEWLEAISLSALVADWIGPNGAPPALAAASPAQRTRERCAAVAASVPNSVFALGNFMASPPSAWVRRVPEHRDHEETT